MSEATSPKASMFVDALDDEEDLPVQLTKEDRLIVASLKLPI